MSKTASSLRIVIVGHVDHGKSTLIGRLLNDTDNLPEGKVSQVEEQSRRRGMPFEWAFVMDALQAERDQGITIDTTQIHFKTERRPYVIIDAPGHAEFLRNMVTGAAGADAALLLIDVREGVLEQSRRHAYLLHLLGVKQVVVVVNKLDAVGFDQSAFDRAAEAIGRYLGELGITPKFFIPISARHGHNVANLAPEMPWYRGPTVLGALDELEPVSAPVGQPLRFPIQDVYKDGDRRILAGRIESGRLRVGDRLRFAPGGHIAEITAIEAWNHPTATLNAVAGQSIGITIDRRLFVERGHVASHEDEPIALARRVSGRIFWLADRSLTPGQALTLTIATAEHRVVVEAIHAVIDVENLEPRASGEIRRNDIAEVTLRARTPIPIDVAEAFAGTGRGVLIDGHDVVGGLVVTDHDGVADRLYGVDHAVTVEDRRRANDHKGGVIWLTGLSGAGKTTLAMALERALFDRGWQTFVLDGDNVRKGLGAGLGFSDADRAENVRRVAETARLFAESGMVAIVSLISPSQAERTRARAIIGDDFIEVFVRADLAECERRDPKGLYRKARLGEIPRFTGVSAPYEPPTSPDLVIDTQKHRPEEARAILLETVLHRYGVSGGRILAVG